MQTEYKVTLEEQPEPADIQKVNDGLRSYNLQFAPDDGYCPLTIFLRAPGGELIGGLLGQTYWGWFHVDVLWLDDATRRQGFGGQMLAMAEEEATRRGCRYAHLDTMSFQALPFYEKHGYTIFGVLDDLPQGHRRIFLKKDLIPMGSS